MNRTIVAAIAGALITAGTAAALAQQPPQQAPMGGPMKGPMGGGMDGMMPGGRHRVGGGMMGMGGHGFGLMRLRMLDANKDGAVTLEEYLAPHTKRFAEIDKNGDGFLDADEITAEARVHIDYWSKRFMHRFDVDKDGKVTKDEFVKRARERFAMGGGMGGAMQPGMPQMPGAPGMPGGMKGMGPGMQDQGQSPGMQQGMGPGMGKGRMGMRRGMGRGMGQGGPVTLEQVLAGMNARFADLDKNGDGVIDAKDLEVMAAARAAEWTKRFLARYDADKDGRVSRDEFLKGPRERFADLDLNGDGRITEDDLPPAMRGRGLLKDAR